MESSLVPSEKRFVNITLEETKAFKDSYLDNSAKVSLVIFWSL